MTFAELRDLVKPTIKARLTRSQTIGLDTTYTPITADVVPSDATVEEIASLFADVLLVVFRNVEVQLTVRGTVVNTNEVDATAVGSLFPPS